MLTTVSFKSARFPLYLPSIMSFTVYGLEARYSELVAGWPWLSAGYAVMLQVCGVKQVQGFICGPSLPHSHWPMHRTWLYSQTADSARANSAKV